MIREKNDRSWFRVGVEISLILTVLALSVVFLVRSGNGTAHLQSTAEQPWSIGYWTPWGSPPIPMSEVDWRGLTHVVHSVALVNADGSLDLQTNSIDANAAALIAMAHAAGVKVLLGIGQPNGQGSNGFLQQAATSNRSALVNNIASAVQQYGYDGVDIDWEPFDTRFNGLAMQSLAADLRVPLSSKIMTAAAAATSWPYWGGVQIYFDRVNIMTYDLSGTWDPYSWHNSALFDQDGQVWSVHLAAVRFLNSGVPKSKLGIGIPFFGWRWSGGQLVGVPGKGITGPRQNWVASAPPSRKQVHYQEIAPLITTGNYRWDYFAKTPYLSVDDPETGSYAFLTFDDAASIAEKINYVYNNNLGGWIIWDLGGDYFPIADVKQPLMDAVRNSMRPVTR